MQVIDQSIWFDNQRILLIFKNYLQTPPGLRNREFIYLADLCLMKNSHVDGEFTVYKNRQMSLVDHKLMLDQIFDSYDLAQEDWQEKLIISQEDNTWYRIMLA